MKPMINHIYLHQFTRDFPSSFTNKHERYQDINVHENCRIQYLQNIHTFNFPKKSYCR